jgi:phosphoribosyl-AMP cyclohydrolase
LESSDVGGRGGTESSDVGGRSSLEPSIAARLKRDAAGLVPAIVQQHDTGEVLMLAWMNDEALWRTLTTGRATYFSRSRGTLWVKGETSGHHQYVKSVALDCDGDTLLVAVDQVGAACHTGQRTCFHNDLTGTGTELLQASNDRTGTGAEPLQASNDLTDASTQPSRPGMDQIQPGSAPTQGEHQ